MSRHRNDIQGLRAIAVLLVVLCHAGVPGVTGGYVGVDVFFVLSGFLITGVLLSGVSKSRWHSLVEFYSRRARRILPAAALTLVATDIAAYGLLNLVRAKQTMQDSVSAALFTANIHFANQGTNYFAQGQPPSPLQHFWSLAVEEQFYLVWPVILALVVLGIGIVLRPATRRGGPRGTKQLTDRTLLRLLIAILVIGGASLFWSVHYTAADPQASYFSTFSRGWELALGAALAIGARHVARVPARLTAILGWLGVACIIVASVTFSSSTQLPGYAALLPTVGAALVIAAGIGTIRTRFDVGRVLGTTPMRYVGDRSYSLYLWHWPILIIAAEHAGHDLSLASKLVLMVGAFVVSIVSYGLFENPIRRMKWSSPAHAMVLWPASLIAVLLVSGWATGKIDAQATALADAGAPQYPGLASNPQQATGGTSSSTFNASFTDSAGASALPAVVAAGQAAQRGAKLPPGLTPPVTNLLQDYYTFPGACSAGQGQTSSTICTLGDTASSKSIALIGDSHAMMWMPAILAMARQDGWVVRPLTKSSCTPPDWFVASMRIPECSAWLSWALQQAERLRPTVLVITGEFGAVDADQAGPVSSGIASLVSRMKPYAKKVVIIGDHPQQSTEPVDCLLSASANMGRCSVALTESWSEINSAIAAGATSAGASFIDTTGWLCAAGYCPQVIGHDIVYRDATHLTETYVLQLASAFRTAFRKAIGSA